MNSNQFSKRIRYEDLKPLSRLQPIRSISRIALEVLFILILIWLGSLCLSWQNARFVLIPVMGLMIASRQHALLVLMHESTHRLISRRRLLNDLIGEWIAWNFFMNMFGYRRHHSQHHKIDNLNTLKDPDFARKQTSVWNFPMSHRKLLVLLLKDIALLNTRDFLHESRDAKNSQLDNTLQRRWFVGRLAYYVLLASLLTYFQLWTVYLVFWVLPLFTFLKAILRIRSIADHFAVKTHPQSYQTRTILAPWWERLLLAPCSIGLHNEHHLYAFIPYYNLKKAHELLASTDSYRQGATISQSYYSTLFKECSQ